MRKRVVVGGIVKWVEDGEETLEERFRLKTLQKREEAHASRVGRRRRNLTPEEKEEAKRDKLRHSIHKIAYTLENVKLPDGEGITKKSLSLLTRRFFPIGSSLENVTILLNMPEFIPAMMGPEEAEREGQTVYTNRPNPYHRTRVLNILNRMDREKIVDYLTENSYRRVNKLKRGKSTE